MKRRGMGQTLGLDRIPEVRTLRAKLDLLCEGSPAVRQWSGNLAREWMEAQPESAGTLYIDGHVRVYHGQLTELPRRYVARQRLCLRGTTDYWVNAMDGQPFFAVTQAADPGCSRPWRNKSCRNYWRRCPANRAFKH